MGEPENHLFLVGFRGFHMDGDQINHTWGYDGISIANYIIAMCLSLRDVMLYGHDVL